MQCDIAFVLIIQVFMWELPYYGTGGGMHFLQETEAVKNKNIDTVTSDKCQEEPTCIIQHPGFHPVYQ